MSSKGLVHLNKLLANGGVNSNLFAKSLQLVVGHDFDVESPGGRCSSEVMEMIVTKRRVVVVVVVVVVRILLLRLFPLHHNRFNLRENE